LMKILGSQITKKKMERRYQVSSLPQVWQNSKIATTKMPRNEDRVQSIIIPYQLVDPQTIGGGIVSSSSRVCCSTSSRIFLPFIILMRVAVIADVSNYQTWNLIHYARRFHLEAQDPTTKSLDNLFSFLSVFHHLIAGSYDAAMIVRFLVIVMYLFE
jgi:hypothetical protein